MWDLLWDGVLDWSEERERERGGGGGGGGGCGGGGTYCT